MVGLEIELPTKRYIKRFLEHNYGSPAQLNRRDKYGNLIFILLEKPSTMDDRDFPNYKTSVPIVLTSYYFVIKSKDLTKTGIMYFNNMIEIDIRNLIRSYMNGMGAGKAMSTRAKMEAALDHYGFSDMDFPLETLKKDIYRHGMGLID